MEKSRPAVSCRSFDPNDVVSSLQNDLPLMLPRMRIYPWQSQFSYEKRRDVIRFIKEETILDCGGGLEECMDITADSIMREYLMYQSSERDSYNLEGFSFASDLLAVNMALDRLRKHMMISPQDMFSQIDNPRHSLFNDMERSEVVILITKKAWGDCRGEPSEYLDIVNRAIDMEYVMHDQFSNKNDYLKWAHVASERLGKRMARERLRKNRRMRLQDMLRDGERAEERDHTDKFIDAKLAKEASVQLTLSWSRSIVQKVYRVSKRTIAAVPKLLCRLN